MLSFRYFKIGESMAVWKQKCSVRKCGICNASESLLKIANRNFFFFVADYLLTVCGQ